jgi:ring-1,2-phenylacetyl-CoA epoxidase subunit PaaB
VQLRAHGGAPFGARGWRVGARGGDSACREAASPRGDGGGLMTAPLVDSQWPLWEVFTQGAHGEPFEHAGSVHAADAEHAMQNARDVYTRRGEAVNLWVVPSTAIVASAPSDAGPFFDPGNDKPYRHPQFYVAPRGVRIF